MAKPVKVEYIRSEYREEATALPYVKLSWQNSDGTDGSCILESGDVPYSVIRTISQLPEIE